MIGNIGSEKPEGRDPRKNSPEIQDLIRKLDACPSPRKTELKRDFHGEIVMIARAVVDGYTYGLVRFPTTAQST